MQRHRLNVLILQLRLQSQGEEDVGGFRCAICQACIIYSAVLSHVSVKGLFFDTCGVNYLEVPVIESYIRHPMSRA